MKMVISLLKKHMVVVGVISGAIIAYCYWLHFGIYWGTYPLSSECWVNCIYGCLIGGLAGCIISEKKTEK
jgi:hypothetical protein